jgi:hypothetical protein
MRTVDPSVVEAIAKVSPLNPYGNPVFRAAWSADVLHWVAGWWNDYDKETGLFIRRVWQARKVPKYQMAARWVIERWMPPEFFGSRESWEQATQIVSEENMLDFALELGPYPSEGEYVHVWTCDDADRNYMELTPTLARYTIDIAMRPVPTVGQMRAEAEERQRANELAQEKMIDDMIGDAFPFLGRVNSVSPTSLMTKIQDQKKRGLKL